MVGDRHLNLSWRGLELGWLGGARLDSFIVKKEEIAVSPRVYGFKAEPLLADRNNIDFSPTHSSCPIDSSL